MHLQAFTIYDTQAESFLPPFFARTQSEALRTFDQLCKDPQSLFSKYPEHFRLYNCGEFHQDTGVVVGRKDGLLLLEEALKLVREA